MKVISRFTAFLLLLFSITVNAASPAERLVAMLEPLVNGSGSFEQVTLDQNGQTVQSSSGKFAVQQPGKFYWHTVQPYEQLLVSDGATIWLYDPDLEQVTVKPFATEQNQLPVRILSGEFTLLKSEFTTTLEEPGDKTLVFHLTPNDKTGSVAVIDLTFNNAVLTAMAVQDKAKTATQFTFSGRQPLTKKDQKKFNFDIPEGADVFQDQ